MRPEFCGHGYNAPVVKQVEAISRWWAQVLRLYTWTTVPVYPWLGWKRVGLEHHTDRKIGVVLVKRDLR